MLFYAGVNLFFILLELSQCVKFSYDANSDVPLLSEGKQQFDVITANAQMPLYGACWSNAVSDLKVGCRYLTEELQSDLALKLTNCFLQMSNQGAIGCLDSRKSCLKQLSDREFNVYTEFYTHTQNICYFLHSKLWHEESEKTIDRLSSTSFKVSMQLADAERGQEALLKQQLKSLNMQESMAENMETSKNKLNAMMEEIQVAAMEQQLALGSLFNQLAILQTWAVGELSWLDSVFFYSSAAILSCLFTSMSRTHRARLPLLLVFTINYGFERYLCSVLNNDSKSVVETSTDLQSWVWFFRKGSIIVSFTIWAFNVLTYCDYNIVNHQILTQIQQQNVELREMLKRYNCRDVLDGYDKDSDIAYAPSTSQLLDEDTWMKNSVEKIIPKAFLSEKRVSSSPAPTSSTRASSVELILANDKSPYTLRRSSRLKKYTSPC